MIATTPLLKFRASLDAFEDWAFSVPKSTPPKSLARYEKLSELSDDFLNFLLSFTFDFNNQLEIDLLDRAVKGDWQTHRLLNRNDAEVIEILTRPYSNALARMYMLIRANRCEDTSLRIQVAQSFLMNDKDEAIRDYSLQMLAQYKWQGTEDYAVQFWETGDLIKQLVALECLSRIDSILLSGYVAQALSGGNRPLKSHAQMIAQEKGLEQAQ